ncbi:TIGR04222 domain-containing membrane protein [Actinokineospora diospyrosa]|uniref:TIGR04222 domain-containing protein n=1 Tax=Actinokineospora diospyrosa TaxID=103728 RepID=A0ABT1IEU8_9PSEU|nr:TIGR04222 domain-containing membrane protein [Actinokineospora diospyrosa]MCP2271168.1 TIGR04222 domain-containing protein [Actinokineospora diospyrosa]
MVGSWLVLLVVAVSVPAWLVVRDHRRARDISVADRFQWDLVYLALLRSGPTRAVDAVVADLVDREVLTATDTHCLVPVAEPENCTPVEREVLRFTGSRTARLQSVRDEVTSTCAAEFKKRIRTLARHGLYMPVSGAGLAFVIVYTFVVYMSMAQFMYWIDGIFMADPPWVWDGPFWRALLLLIVLWAAPVALITWRERGFRTAVRTPLGRAVAAHLACTAPDSLGTWVAIHGLTTTDPEDSRALILGNAAPV